MKPVVLLRNKVREQEKISGSDIGRPKGPKMTQSVILGVYIDLALAMKEAGSLLESR